jgi:2-hydroxychromene-2-carboxylate isomerase
VLDQLGQSYDIELIPLVVGTPPVSSTPEVEMLQDHSIKDASMIAPHYGLHFESNKTRIRPENIKIAQAILLTTKQESFAKIAQEVGEALWGNDLDRLKALQKNKAMISNEEIFKRISENNRKQKQLGHYFGGIFAYEGECYWNIDRLPFLEERLIALGANKFNRPSILERTPSTDKLQPIISGMTLEVIFSARSPYSYLALPQLIEFRKKFPVKIVYRPILPMVMRGMTINKEKQLYIVHDCKRVAEKKGIPFGNIADPLGKAVERCYSLFQHVQENGKEEEYFNNFLKAVWAEGQHGYLTKTLKNIVEKIGLNWKEAKTKLDNNEWHQIIEKNRQVLYSQGKWGVPTMILKNQNEKTVLSVWGQDRIWLIEEEIHKMNS